MVLHNFLQKAYKQEYEKRAKEIFEMEEKQKVFSPDPEKTK